MSICRWCALYIKNPKESTKKTIRTNTEFSKFTGYKINVEKKKKDYLFLHSSPKIVLIRVQVDLQIGLQSKNCDNFLEG